MGSWLDHLVYSDSLIIIRSGPKQKNGRLSSRSVKLYVLNLFVVLIWFIVFFSPGNKFRLALVQLSVGANKSSNLTNAIRRIKEAASEGARMIVLPECFNSPYGTQYFSEYSEPIPGESTNCLAAVAKETSTYVVGGTW